jgi:threonine/homoserine/homoserine lactone efflux protein
VGRITLWGAFRTGFFTNLFNPKAMIFFVSLLSTVMPAAELQRLGAWVVVQLFVMTLVWFGLLAAVLSHAKVQGGVKKYQGKLESLSGLAFLAMGATVLFAPL